MALPEQVVDRLGREPASTQGWASGMLLFFGGIFFLLIVIYLSMVYGYEPHVESQITQAKNQITQLDQSISQTDQANLIHFYSQISNLKNLLAKHVLMSQFFKWLQNNTEANVYYQALTVAQGDKITLTAYAATEGDANQQISIFENSPEVSAVSVSGVQSSPSGGWTFTATLTMSPSVFTHSTP